MEGKGLTEPAQSLADLILNSPQAVSQSDKFSIETAPDRFFLLHPSACWVDQYIVCDHEVVRADRHQLMRLLDHPKAKLDYAEAAWLFERIKERAPRFCERYIVLTNEYMWDRETSTLIPLPMGVKTTNNKTTRRRLGNERRRSAGGI